MGLVTLRWVSHWAQQHRLGLENLSVAVRPQRPCQRLPVGQRSQTEPVHGPQKRPEQSEGGSCAALTARAVRPRDRTRGAPRVARPRRRQ